MLDRLPSTTRTRSVLPDRFKAIESPLGNMLAWKRSSSGSSNADLRASLIELATTTVARIRPHAARSQRR
jgi:hypothetical protein